MMEFFWDWMWRMLLLGALGVVLLFGLDALGVMETIGEVGSGLLGVVLGGAALFGGYFWADA
jgi:hypothetical protein